MLLDVNERRVAHPAPAILRTFETCYQGRLALDSVVLRTADATLDVPGLAAHAAGLQVLEPGEQLALQLLVPADVLARLLQLGREQSAQVLHRFGTAIGLPPTVQRLDGLVQRDAKPVQEVDPPYPIDRLGMVEPEPARRPRRRL